MSEEKMNGNLSARTRQFQHLEKKSAFNEPDITQDLVVGCLLAVRDRADNVRSSLGGILTSLADTPNISVENFMNSYDARWIGGEATASPQNYVEKLTSQNPFDEFRSQDGRSL